MEMVSVETGFTGRRRNWCSGGYFNSGRNINHLLWGDYKVYRVKMCGQIELDIQ